VAVAALGRAREADQADDRSACEQTLAQVQRAIESTVAMSFALAVMELTDGRIKCRSCVDNRTENFSTDSRPALRAAGPEVRLERP
jgi:hypothetical protein